MNTPLKVVVIIICLAVIFYIVRAVLIIWARHHLEKILFDLPWMKWFTLDQVVAMGHSRFWCKLLLPILHEHGRLEVRLQSMGKLENLPEAIQKLVKENFGEEIRDAEELPFTYQTVWLHDFRLTSKPRRQRKRKFSFGLSLNPLSGWEPAKA